MPWSVLRVRCASVIQFEFKIVEILTSMKAIDHSMASIDTTKAITKAMAGASQRSRSRIGSREPPRVSRHGWIHFRNIIVNVIVQSIPSENCASLRRILAFLGTTALVMRALLENPGLIDWMLLPKALRGLLALLCGNGYIVGINQIYDFGIDKVNKPFLPIAAGDLSIPSAWALVIGLAALGFGIVATNFGNLITSLYTFGLFLGTIYSVPPLRLKQFAVPAFMIIATVRGFLLNFGVYYATRAALGLPYQWSPSILFITIFVTVFATVIAITKDLPDIEGDKKFDISTFATKLGVRKISMLGAGLLLANYVGAIAAGLYLPHAFKTKLMVAGHATLGICLVYQTWLLDSAKYSKEAIANFYRFIWYLFYSEYAMLPFI